MRKLAEHMLVDKSIPRDRKHPNMQCIGARLEVSFIHVQTDLSLDNDIILKTTVNCLQLRSTFKIILILLYEIEVNVDNG